MLRVHALALLSRAAKEKAWQSPSDNYSPQNGDFGQVGAKKVEIYFLQTQKSPIGLNPTGQILFYAILLHCIVHIVGRNSPMTGAGFF
jgi:hypothetical protein